jgi:hypothetical protein
MLPSSVLMIRPSYFGFNPETAVSNRFQHEMPELDTETLRQLANEEFDHFVSLLKAWDIDVWVFDDVPVPHTPDAVFPNNWFSTHANGWLITYPMKDKLRRTERRNDILQALVFRHEYVLKRDLEMLESNEQYLEGTGSLVFDRANRIAYAAISPRTNPAALAAWAKLTGYQTVSFHANGPDNSPIYHTNVMMSIGDNFALIGLETLSAADRDKVVQSLEQGNKRIIELTMDQIYDSFAGNMLALSNPAGERLLVMSAAAKRSLTTAQKNILQYELGLVLIAAPLSIIEEVGGGSARCMLAEIVVPER